MHGVKKFSLDGRVVWESLLESKVPSHVGNTLVGLGMRDCTAFALDLDAGKPIWKQKLWPNSGAHSDFVQAHNGMAVVGVGLKGPMTNSGGASSFAAGFNVLDGSLLWHFEVECGFWDIMALFPDDETTIFQDLCGGVFRMGLHNGTLLWKTSGEVPSFTDGGATLGPDGRTHTCSNPAMQNGNAGQSGLLRKYQLSGGAPIGTAELPYPCMTWPAVSPDGRRVAIAPGALATVAKTREFLLKTPAKQETLHQQHLALGNKQRAFYGLPDPPAALMAFDTETGELQWRHEVEPWGRLALTGDEQRARVWLKNPLTTLPRCWPGHWSPPTVDDEGTVYIARSSGDIYVYNPERGGTKFPIGDGALFSGAASAPGMMAIASCSAVFIFKTPEL